MADLGHAAEAVGRLPIEIAFLAAHGLPDALLRCAAARAAEQGVGAEAVLIAEGVVTEAAYYRSLARTLGLPFSRCPAYRRENPVTALPRRGLGTRRNQRRAVTRLPPT